MPHLLFVGTAHAQRSGHTVFDIGFPLSAGRTRTPASAAARASAA